MLCINVKCYANKTSNVSEGLISPPYAMQSPGKQLPSKKDHELFTFPKKRNKTPFTRSRNKSYQKATNPEDATSKVISDFIAPDMFEKSDHDQKLTTIITSLNKLHNKLDSINTDLYKEKDGIWPRLETAEDSLENVADSQDSLRFEMTVMKGVIQKQEEQITTLVHKVDELTMRSMAANITISGLIQEEATENCEDVVIEFIKSHMELEIKKKDILVAHRTGVSNKYGERLMVVRCMPKLKDLLLQNSKKLATKVNKHNRKYYVNPQVPEHILAEKKERSYQIQQVEETNKTLADDMKLRYSIKNRVLYVNDTPQNKTVYPPTFGDILPEYQEQEKMERIKLWYSEPKTEKGNVFTAIAAKVSGVMEINRAYRRVKQLYPGATHISLGYDCQKIKNNHDDGEHQAGLQIQKLLQTHNITNKAIFVVRQASGTKLGPRRFQIIEEAVSEVFTKIK